ncbi:MerR family transcriptional regulator [Rhodovulum sp. FJ3]|uniref:MerR family transcriptional regulator n=1 Tax=Rhodovulum sp. FJ3 TaxID=3079053 RepID=UPI00293DC214|nr:MerR family transcriptional regulator [Rhodovulum sp. FJ3]MDV4167963.1 MerR family transcriptional regulator [Rhodovulum sp. FJ3]
MAKSKDAFRTIREVSEWLDTPAHVLRFWESKFTQVKPVKRAGGRRYYRPADMLLLGGIKKLLHDDGMTIRGVQKMLREQGVKHVAALSQELDGETVEIVDIPADPLPDEAPMAVDVPTLPEPEPETSAEAGEADNVVPMTRRERRLANNRRRVEEKRKEDERQADLFGGFDPEPEPEVEEPEAVHAAEKAEETPPEPDNPEPVQTAPEETVEESPAPDEVSDSEPDAETPAESQDLPAAPTNEPAVLGADLPEADKALSEYVARDTVASALISRSTRRALVRKHPEKLVEILPRLTALAERMGAETKG